MRLPRRKRPIRIRMSPAIIVARTSPFIPYCATIPATIVANAAVGPDIWTLEPPRNEITKPAMIAV